MIAVAPNNAVSLPLAGGTPVLAQTGTKSPSGDWIVSNEKPGSAHTIVTDGKGGIAIYINSNDPALKTGNPVIRTSILIHEGSHRGDAYASNNAIANDAQAGFMIKATSRTVANASEISAYTAQLAYLDRALGNPAAFGLDRFQAQEVYTYRQFVQGTLNVRYLGLPRGEP